jgi:hypothetical protein
MKQVAILTMDSLEGFFAYDTMLDEPMRAAGWQTTHVPWRDESVDWNQFDVVIVRSPWDYQQAADQFITCLQRIEASSAVLENPYSLMVWNIDKQYLRDLSAASVPIVPTLWKDHYEAEMLVQGFAQFETDTLIVKPTISANADDTFKIKQGEQDEFASTLAKLFASRPLMIQPFLPAVLSPGEFSLFYFNHRYSHAILKTPKSGDFRVQEEHGGQLRSIEPSEQMRRVTEHTLAALPTKSLYARVDLIDLSGGSDENFAVMEVELIEPSLYFNMDTGSAQRFADQFLAKFGT